MAAQQDAPSAIEVLSELLEKESNSISQNLRNANPLDFYRQTSTSLQFLLVGSGDQQRAIEVTQKWIDLANAVIALPTARAPQWFFAIDANHTAGHLYQQIGRNTDSLNRIPKRLNAAMKLSNAIFERQRFCPMKSSCICTFSK
jgi:hypothetical protein